jgi:hypothetical protein
MERGTLHAKALPKGSNNNRLYKVKLYIYKKWEKRECDGLAGAARCDAQPHRSLWLIKYQTI